MPDPPFSIRTVALVGTGLIGGSLGMALRARVPSVRVVAVDVEGVAADAVAAGAADVAMPLPDAVRIADLVVVAAPPDVSLELIREIAPHLRPSAILSDVGSVKAPFLAAATAAIPDARRIVGGHPMAGRETGGLGSADARLFENAAWVLCPAQDDQRPTTEDGENRRADTSAVDALAALVSAIGARVVVMDAARHDRTAAAVSHVPQLAAVALVTAALGDDPGARRLAGGGFRDVTRIAASPWPLWQGILSANHGAALAALDGLREALDAAPATPSRAATGPPSTPPSPAPRTCAAASPSTPAASCARSPRSRSTPTTAPASSPVSRPRSPVPGSTSPTSNSSRSAKASTASSASPSPPTPTAPPPSPPSPPPGSWRGCGDGVTCPTVRRGRRDASAMRLYHASSYRPRIAGMPMRASRWEIGAVEVTRGGLATLKRQPISTTMLPPDRYHGYRVSSARHPTHAYDRAGTYFVTHCVMGRLPKLGHMRDGWGVHLTPLGHLAALEWHRTALVRPDVAVGALVVMPDHVHVVLILAEDGASAVPSVVRHVKGAVTREGRRLGLLGADERLWQPRYHDRIVRSEREAASVRRYIAANPARWWDDHGHGLPDP